MCDSPGRRRGALDSPGSSVRRRLRRSDQQSGEWTTTARCWDSLPMLEHRHPPAYRRVQSLGCALGESPPRPRSGGSPTVLRPRRRLRRSAHRSGDSPTMPWYRVSFGMLKHPPIGRVDSSRVSDAPPRMLSTGSGFATVGDRFTTRRRLRWSAHGSGDCPTTAWYRVRCGMLKVPAAGRPDASGVVGCALELHARRGGR